MAGFTHDFVSSFERTFPQGVQTGVSYAERMMMLDYQKELDARKQEQEDEQFRMDKELYDIKIGEIERERDMEKRKADLAMGVMVQQEKVGKIKAQPDISPGVAGGPRKKTISKKDALRVPLAKLEQMETELRFLKDPLSMLPEKLGAKERAGIEYTEAGTVLRAAQTKAAEALAGLRDKKRTEPQKEEDRKTIYNFVRDWLKLNITEEEKEGLTSEQYNKWLSSLAKQYRDGVRPENFQLPKITPKEPIVRRLRRDIPQADTSFYSSEQLSDREKANQALQSGRWTQEQYDNFMEQLGE